MRFFMRVCFLVVVVALVATVAPPLSGRAKIQKRKREARAVSKPTPTPSSSSADSTNTSKASSGEDAEPWATQSIKSISDARRIFEAMDGSLYRMMRDHPDRWGEYFDLKIDDKQEHQWRREMISKLS